MYRCEPPFYADPGQPPRPLHGQQMYLVCGRNVQAPGYYVSWSGLPSAELQYKHNSGATVKGYHDFQALKAAWYARCDQGEHDHPVDPARSLPVPQSSTPAPAPLPLASTLVHTPRSPVASSSTLPVYIIDSRSPSPQTPIESPPSYASSPPSSPPSGSRSWTREPAGLMHYAVRLGREGETYTDASEARDRFLALQNVGLSPGYVVSSSLARSLEWIAQTPGEGQCDPVGSRKKIVPAPAGGFPATANVESPGRDESDDSDVSRMTDDLEQELRARESFGTNWRDFFELVHLNESNFYPRSLTQDPVYSASLLQVSMAGKKRKRAVFVNDPGVTCHCVYSYESAPARGADASSSPFSREKGHDNFDYLMGYADAGDDFPQVPLAKDQRHQDQAKRYENSDHPVKTWIPERDNCLDGLMQREGRGPWWSRGCTLCHEANPTWRCEDCFGGRMYQWEDDFFRPRTLKDLGCAIKLDTRRRTMPLRPSLTSVKGFVVLHDNGIHVLDVDFCSCRGAPTEAKVAAYDFYNTLVLLRNGSGLRKPPHRLPQFMHMVREYRHLQMCKRAGRGHDPLGIAGTKAGELAIPCRACPHPGINLPEGWEDAPPEVAWIYRMMLSQDANFKLKGRDRSSREKDPTLGPGWAYMVASDAYLKHLAKFVAEDEISHCVSFAALWSANNKRAKGLRASGLGSSRRDWRFTGGERYSNMDYLFFSSVMGFMLLALVASYDIACQWGRNFWERAKKMPPEMQLPDWVQIIFKVPKFHLPPHVKKCHGPYSFNYTKGVGRTDGEGVEWNWSWLNRAARFISVMGPGSRDDTLDDLCGWGNWRKTVDLEDHEPELREWEKIVRAWDEDNEQTNPYEYPDVEAETWQMSCYDLRGRARASGRTGGSCPACKAFGFFDGGIDIEEDHSPGGQTEDKNNDPGHGAATAAYHPSGKVSALRDVQESYMPGLRRWVGQQNPALPAADNSKPETIKIYLPSAIPADAREAVCVPGLVKQEEELRNAQAVEALRELRSGLRTRTFAHQFKRKLPSNQGMYTKSRTLTDGIEDRIRAASARYRTARAALLQLRGPGDWETRLKVLEKSDVRGMNERAMNDEEKEEIGKHGCLLVWAKTGTPMSEGQHSSRGFGTQLPVPGQGADGKLHDGRLKQLECEQGLIFLFRHPRGVDEGTRRAERWREELLFLEAEMQRVLDFCGGRPGGGRNVGTGETASRGTISPQLAEGLRAYALEQVDREERWAKTWEVKWAAVRARAALVVRDHLVDVTEDLMEPLEVELEDEDAEREEFGPTEDKEEE
ncbi:hypothetical protein B0H13DRAFT_1885266 [Mycena leptocephala]|nr:hypothetical protein B0H13DRAFT_1885266 [Mycena leptocephala]